MVAGVSRDILTKFQENRSSRFQSHRVLLYFWSFFGNLHRVPPMEKISKVLRVITAYMPNFATVDYCSWLCRSWCCFLSGLTLYCPLGNRSRQKGEVDSTNVEVVDCQRPPQAVCFWYYCPNKQKSGPLSDNMLCVTVVGP